MDLDSLRPHRRRSPGAQQPAHTDRRPWRRRSGTFAQSWYATGHRRWTASRRPSGQDAPQRTFTMAVRPARWRQPTQAPASPKLQSKDGRLSDQASRPTLQRPAIAGFALQPISGQDVCQVSYARSLPVLSSSAPHPPRPIRLGPVRGRRFTGVCCLATSWRGADKEIADAKGPGMSVRKARGVWSPAAPAVGKWADRREERSLFSPPC